MHNLTVKRVYDKAEDTDGFRVLVDRLWPRGIKKAQANVDLWLKEVAPSHALRQWFNHEAEKWSDFQRRYRGELESKDALIQQILRPLAEKNVTLLYASRETEHNHALVLKDYLKLALKRGEKILDRTL